MQEEWFFADGQCSAWAEGWAQSVTIGQQSWEDQTGLGVSSAQGGEAWKSRTGSDSGCRFGVLNGLRGASQHAKLVSGSRGRSSGAEWSAVGLDNDRLA